MNLQMRKYRTVESWFGGFTYIYPFCFRNKTRGKAFSIFIRYVVNRAKIYQN